MSVKKDGARLWFETKQEEDEYDDLMMAEMELKSDNYDDENYTVVALRSKKEKLPGNHSETYYNGLARMEAMTIGKSHVRIGEHGWKDSISLLVNKDMYLTRYYWAYVGGYLLLRELPLRNFYARSLIMFAFFTKYYSTWGLPDLLGNFTSVNPKALGHADHNKERRIFHFLNDTDNCLTLSLNRTGSNSIYLNINNLRNE